MGLFQRLPNGDLNRLALAFERHSFPDGHVIFHQGDTGDVMYVVESGKVEIIRTDERGSRFKLAEVGSAGYFGELALLSDKPRAATVITVGETEVLSISGRALKRLLAESAPALRGVIGTIKEYRPPERPPSAVERLRSRETKKSKDALDASQTTSQEEVAAALDLVTQTKQPRLRAVREALGTYFDRRMILSLGGTAVALALIGLYIINIAQPPAVAPPNQTAAAPRPDISQYLSAGAKQALAGESRGVPTVVADQALPTDATPSQP